MERYGAQIHRSFAGTGKLQSLHDEPIDITKEQIEETKKRAIISLKDKYLSYFNDLNDTGKEKAIEQVKLLTKIPEYKKTLETITRIKNKTHFSWINTHLSAFL